MTERDEIIKQLKKAGHDSAAEYLRLTGEHKLTFDDIEIHRGKLGDDEVWTVFDIRPLKTYKFRSILECDVLIMVNSEGELMEELEKLGLSVKEDDEELTEDQK